MLLVSKYDTRIEAHPLSAHDLAEDNPFVHRMTKSGNEIKIK